MRSYFTIFILFAFLCQASATSYIRFWVNGAEADSAIQGDQFAWEYDVSELGGSAMVTIFVDQDSNGVIDDGDDQIVRFSQTDGGLENGGPADSSITPDGIVFTMFDIFGFAPGHYIFHIEDDQDESTVTGQFFMDQKETMNVWATGTISIEGTSAPNTILENHMIIAEPDDESIGIWSGLTDENGDYTIILSDSALNTTWTISMIDDDPVHGYGNTPAEYANVDFSLGANGSYDFLFTPFSTVIYGNVYDEVGGLVNVDDYGYLQNLNSESGRSFSIIGGAYSAYAEFQGNDTSNVPFQIHLDGDNFIPDFLIPNTWNIDYYSFNLSLGDTLRKDIHLLETDSVIHVIITRNEGVPINTYYVEANTDSGHTVDLSDAQGYAQLSIKSGFTYHIQIDEEVNDVPSLPPGYIVENGNSAQAVAGDTVRFNLVPAQSVLSGTIQIDSADIGYLEPDEFESLAYLGSGDEQYSGFIDFDSGYYNIPVPNGDFDVELNNWPMDFLSMPARWENISVTNSLVDTLNFELNYTHATLTVRLRNAPESVFDNWQWWNITTEGDYPWVYQTYAGLESDTAYYFRVCEGDWYIPVPDVGSGYTPIFEDSTISVTGGVSEYELIIEYLNPSSIEQSTLIPGEFSVKQNYPNPFNPVTNFEFVLPQNSHVLLEIFSLTGQKVATVINGHMKAGIYCVPWNAGYLASGMYFFRIQANQRVESKKLLLLK